MPESTHMMMWVLSDRAIPRSYRMMQGFGVNTFTLINEQGQRHFVKFHWKPLLGVHSLVWDECLKINGTDPDYHRRDLYDAIENMAYPEYELGIQVVSEADEDKFDFDILDDTKIIPEELVPVQPIGRMVLNQNPSEFFTEVEQVAFCTQNIVPGIGYSDDPVLQGRNFSYLDTQLTRLGGPNFNELPINRPRCPVINHQRDGFMRYDINPSKINYWPNRQGMVKGANDGDLYNPSEVLTHEPELNQHYEKKQKVAAQHKAYLFYEEKVHGIKTRMLGPKFNEHYSQARLFYNSLSAVEQAHIAEAAIFELGHVDDLNVRQRVIDRMSVVDMELAKKVAFQIGVNVSISAPPPIHKISASHPSPARSPGLSQLNTVFASIQSRKVAILLADGYDPVSFAAVRASLSAAQAVPFAVSMRRGVIYSSAAPSTQDTGKVQRGKESESPSDGSSVNAVWSVKTAKSVLFDACVIADGANSVATLSKSGDAIGWVSETFKHFKAILAIGAGIQLLEAAHLPLLAGLQTAKKNDGAKVIESQGVISVFEWSSSPLPSVSSLMGGEEKEEKKDMSGSSGSSGSGSGSGSSKSGGGIMGDAASRVSGAVSAAASAVVGLASSLAGAEASEGVSKYLANEATGKFINTMAKHRCWERQTERVPG